MERMEGRSHEIILEEIDRIAPFIEDNTNSELQEEGWVEIFSYRKGDVAHFSPVLDCLRDHEFMDESEESTIEFCRVRCDDMPDIPDREKIIIVMKRTGENPDQENSNLSL